MGSTRGRRRVVTGVMGTMGGATPLDLAAVMEELRRRSPAQHAALLVVIRGLVQKF